MASAYPNQNNSWLKIDQSYINKNADSDPFFDPLSLSMNEFKPVPLPDDDFTPFLDKYNDIDNMLSETLGFQDLNIPSGYQQQELFDQSGLSGSGTKKHSRRISGSAIFGFLNGHSHQLSIPGIATSESAYKKMNELMDYYNSNNLSQLNDPQELISGKKNDLPPQQHKRSIEIPKEGLDDFIITGKNPVAFKFPPLQEFIVQNDKERNSGYVNGKAFKNEQRPAQDQPVNISPQFLDMQLFSNENYSVELMNKNQPISRDRMGFKDDDLTDEEDPFLSLDPLNGKLNPETRNGKNNFYLLPPQDILGKPMANLSQTKLVYSSPEEIYSSPNNSPILPSNLFISPQHNPPQLPDLQTPEKLKLPPAPKLQPASLMTPTKLTMGSQDNLAEKYLQYGRPNTETPKKQMIGDNEQVFWTPILVTKNDPNSSKIIKDQLKKSVSPKRKETKITSTLPKGHLEQYFIGPDESDKFTCTFNQCGKQFTRISNTRAHIQTHLSDRPYACELCEKCFVRNHDLRRHQRSHQEFSFVCPCGKKFPRQDALKRHRIRKICCGAIEDDRPVSPDKKYVTKPLKKKGRPRKEDELQDGLRDRILEDLNNNAEDLDFGYLLNTAELDKDNNLLLSGIRSNNEQRSYGQDPSNVFDDFNYGTFNL